jgi:hypothetical protein
MKAEFNKDEQRDRILRAKQVILEYTLLALDSFEAEYDEKLL